MEKKEYKLTVISRPSSGRRRTTVSGGSSGGSTFIYSSANHISGAINPDVPAILDPDTSTSTVTPPKTEMAWILTPSPTSVKASTGAVYVSCTVERIVNGKNQRLSTDDDLAAAGVALWVKIDQGDWMPYTIGRSRLIVSRAQERFYMRVKRSRMLLSTQGTDVDATLAQHLVSFELRDTAGLGETYAAVSVPVVRDGSKGSAGPMVYPAGKWSASEVYEATEVARPVVEYGGQYYVLSVVGESVGVNPAKDYADNGEEASWQLMDRFSYVFADVLMANFAKLGSAVFYGDYMFSQDGTINGEAVSGMDENGEAYYTRFTDGQTAGTFIPNICVNFKSGYFAGAVGVFSGNLKTLFVEASKSDAATDVAGYYKIRDHHKLLSRENGAIFELPDDARLVGSRVMICDPRLTVTSSTRPMIIKPEKSNDVIVGTSPDSITSTSGVRRIEMYAGVCELLAVPKTDWRGELAAEGCQWMVLALTARYSESSDIVFVGKDTITIKPLPEHFRDTLAPLV